MEMKKMEIKSALTGSRTRIYCLEGNNANHYTINARMMDWDIFVYMNQI